MNNQYSALCAEYQQVRKDYERLRVHPNIHILKISYSVLSIDYFFDFVLFMCGQVKSHNLEIVTVGSTWKCARRNISNPIWHLTYSISSID
jgi:hypothetical protein